MNKKKSSFMGSLGSHHWQETDDGSQTLYSDYFGEACHSIAGATEETLYNYVKGCLVLERALMQSSISIFEVGFGIGLGWKCTHETLSESNTPLLFISCEIDEKLAIDRVQTLELESYQMISGPLKYIKGRHGQDQLLILLGDIRKTLPQAIKEGLISKVDAIYQDAFSPKRNSALWTTEWFKALAMIAHDETIMSTYSSAKYVWKAMIEAGWKVSDTAGFQTKKISTRATRTGKSSETVLNLVERSPIAALTDESIHETI